MANAVRCAACGGKIRENREHCLRCGAPLVAAPEAPAPRARRRPRIAAAVAAAGLLVVGLGAMLLPRPAASAPPVVEPPKAPAVTIRAPKGVSAVEPDRAAVALDASRVALASYRSGDIAGSIDGFREAVTANPDDAAALNNLGQVLVRDGHPAEAIGYFDRAIALSAATWSYHFNRARAYAEMKQWPQAIADYREAAQLFPDDYATQFNLGKAYQANGDLAAAVESFASAIALAPGQSDFHLSYGLALEAAKRPREAAAAYRKYLELEPAAPEAEKIKARIIALEAL